VNEAEAWATVLTAQLVPPRRHWAHIDVFTDNRVWCGALGRDWSKAPLIDIIRQLVTIDLTAKRRYPATARRVLLALSYPTLFERFPKIPSNVSKRAGRGTGPEDAV
jgi:hypothetical protein